MRLYSCPFPFVIPVPSAFGGFRDGVKVSTGAELACVSTGAGCTEGGPEGHVNSSLFFLIVQAPAFFFVLLNLKFYPLISNVGGEKADRALKAET